MSLKSPFRFQDRHVVLSDHVLFVPPHYDRYEEFTFPGWEHESIFGNQLPVTLEFCSGNGEWIAHRAQLTKGEKNWVAVEKRFDRTRKIWARREKYQLDNLFAICGEAYLASRLYLPSESVEEVYINFPDPWPKSRHIKHRLMHQAFIHEVHRLLKPNSCLTFVSDDRDYVERMLEVMQQHSGFVPCFAEPFFVLDLPGYGSSFFDALWRQKSRDIHYVQFRKQVEVGSGAHCQQSIESTTSSLQYC
jgi:tRNA (guanine-N7-)-methyltransferase